jgi:hypothetical protein
VAGSRRCCPWGLPFPRDRTSDGFMAVFREVHALIHAEIAGPGTTPA